MKRSSVGVKTTAKRRLVLSKKRIAPVMKLIGMRLVSAKQGRAILTLGASGKHRNTVGAVHGGILCDLTDAAMGYAFMSRLRKHQAGVTAEFKINFLRPAFPSDLLIATARMISRGSTLQFAECEVRKRANKTNRLIAKASATFKIL